MAGELTGVIQIGIPAKDIERATAFYRDVLGMQLLMTPPNMAFLNCGGIRIYLDTRGPLAAGGNSLVYFQTDDIDAVHVRLKERGVLIDQEPHLIAKLPDRDVWLMEIRDSESNLLGIMEERRT
jgi:methylmalonyl-CoA/ethylmalonyl-CoA epimerase